MKMWAIRNKKTGRLLIGEPESEEAYGDIYRYFQLRDGEYGGQVFVTTEEATANILLMDGRSNYPDIRIDFGYAKNKFTNTDLEMVEVQVTPK